MTNPDTSTLNGSLEQLGLTMASNLVTKGVTGASASDGLTTLAGKILQVPSGGGGGTALLQLTTNKPVISKYDNETCTLTATLTGDTIEGQTITFYKGTTSIGTATTDSSGIATKTYTSNGDGDLTFKATTSTLTSNTVQIEDCYWYDPCTSDKTSEYTKTCGLTYDNNGYYILSASNSSQYLTHPIGSVTDPCLVECELYNANNENTQLRSIGLINNSNVGKGGKVSPIDSEIKTLKVNTLTGVTETSTTSNVTLTGAWIRFKLSLSEKTTLVEVFNIETGFIADNVSPYDASYTYDRFHIFIGKWAGSLTPYIRNIKVKRRD